MSFGALPRHDDGSEGVQYDRYTLLIGSCFPLLASILLSLFSVEVGQSVLLAAFRCFLQLQLLSLFLAPVFDRTDIWPTMGLTVLLLLAGTQEIALRRAKFTVQRLFSLVFTCLALIVFPLTIIANKVALEPMTWYKPMSFIPLFGMAMGNSISAMTLGIGHLLGHAVSSQESIEAMIAYGATPSELFVKFIPDALSVALNPTLNQMRIVGLITIPGTMTGAILAGSPVQQAAILQTYLLFVITTISACACLVSLSWIFFILFDSQGRMRLDRIKAHTFTSPSLIQSLFAFFRRRRRRQRRSSGVIALP